MPRGIMSTEIFMRLMQTRARKDYGVEMAYGSQDVSLRDGILTQQNEQYWPQKTRYTVVPRRVYVELGEH